MPKNVPPNVRPDRYRVLTKEQAGPALDPIKGYSIVDLKGGVYVVGDNTYNTMFVVSNEGVILVDAPPALGPKIQAAIQEVSPGSQIVALIYSHQHVDHIGFAAEVVKTNPSMKIFAHEETRKLLARAEDPNRPLPTDTFASEDSDFPIQIGDQRLVLRYPGSNHDVGNIGIFHPQQRVLMLVDVVYPGWMMWRRLGLATDIRGYFQLVKEMSATWDFEHLVAGHFQPGTKADVAAQYEFMADMHQASLEAIRTIPYADGKLDPANANNSWAATRDWMDRVTNHCVNAVTPKWSERLAGFDVWIYDQCAAVEQAIRLEGPLTR
ncbi:Metallo-beta-lactamase superfamily protein [compost metagenome]